MCMCIEGVILGGVEYNDRWPMNDTQLMYDTALHVIKDRRIHSFMHLIASAGNIHIFPPFSVSSPQQTSVFSSIYRLKS